ncbi:MAG: serine hydrolase [Saprospiraceae bacterium]|nr:serine hydrolase [Saprospiraceae bacterium]
MKKLSFLAFLFLTTTVFGQEKTDKLLLNILQKKSELFGKILEESSKYRVQILYTQIDRDKNNVPHFKSYAYRLNKDEYFYPASTVKFPACLLALEKLNQLKINGLTRKTWMLSDSAFDGQIRQTKDESNLENGGLPTIEHYIKKILVVSDNDAFNRLYEFVGQEAFNETLYKKGYKDLRIVHRLQTPMSREQNRRSNPIIFRNKSVGDELTLSDVYRQPMLINPKTYEPKSPIKLGKGYMRGDKLVEEGFDFTYKNYFSIENQQAILRGVLFPESVAPEQRFDLTKDDYTFLYKYMSQLPTETLSPPYAKDTSLYDSYCKFFMFGDSKKPMPSTMRIFNKVGDAYGFLIDNAYIVDFEKKVEFMLTAVIYCNSDGIFNDDKYDYDNIGFPFMANLGKTIYEYEVKRKRKIKPNLSKFVLTYDK